MATTSATPGRSPGPGEVFDFTGSFVANTITDGYGGVRPTQFTAWAMTVTGQSSSGSITVQVWKNGSSTQTLTLAANTSSAYGALSPFVSIAAGDILQVKVINIGTGATGLVVTLA